MAKKIVRIDVGDTEVSGLDARDLWQSAIRLSGGAHTFIEHADVPGVLDFEEFTDPSKRETLFSHLDLIVKRAPELKAAIEKSLAAKKVA